MSNVERAVAHIREQQEQGWTNAYRKSANDRKREVYWIGFLEGTLASSRIEDGEAAALLAEVDRFRTFFDDPDADDLAEDLRARCFASEDELIAQLEDVVRTRRGETARRAAYSETDEVNEFLGFCAGIVCDGVILQSEAHAMLRRFQTSETLMTAVAFQPLRRAVESALSDGVFTREEAEDVRDWIAQLVGDGFIDTGLPNIGSVARLDDPITDPLQVRIAGARFVLTGPMSMGPRTFIRSEIERVGGLFEAGMTRRTDYLVVSSRASRHWRTTHFGAKIERAKELIEAGSPIRFVSESALARAIAAADAAG